MKVTLTKWAAARYDPLPSLWTLRRWAREGELHPPPELVGKTYYIDENARRLSIPEPKATLVDRMKATA
jgi:predicted site-specific integrase-resolvase